MSFSGGGSNMFGRRSNKDICGCYFVLNRQRSYLPQVAIDSHTAIYPVSFTTHLTQTFNNPNETKLDQVRYTFPLYDGVAVCGYTITYAGKILKGIVKEKNDAKRTYQAAVDRGETAGLLEALPTGVFGVTLGNVSPKTDIVVDITYCGELKHDASIDGLRYTLPTAIAPRYGEYPGAMLTSNTRNDGGIKITIDIDMGQSAIRRVQSPSHPIAVTMGELSTASPSQAIPFNSSHSSATLAQGSAELGSDFVLQVLVDDLNKPQAVLEVHPTLPNHRAIMATLVPQFALPCANPEIVFIADQSGSMRGEKNSSLVAALKVFLKSLPLGVRFNICAFGSTYDFLWTKSQPYNEGNLNTAIAFVDGFAADYGGTDIYDPLQQAFSNRLGDLPLEVMLLTDGQIRAEGQVFDFLNEQIQEKNVDARLFALGIGDDVSHTLVEGAARAGRGFAQFVTQTEETDRKVVRMLKGALYAHTKDYSLEVHFEDEKKAEDDEDDFELVEKLSDGLVISIPGDNEPSIVPTSAHTSGPISFFDTTVNIDEKPIPVPRYSHLPAVPTPKILQAPTTIVPLFPSNRSTVYLLLGPDSCQRPVKSLTLRAISAAGPLELDISLHQATSGKEIGMSSGIHVLAARKAIQDLEEGRGWLQSATVSPSTHESSSTGNLPVKDRYPSYFGEMVEREAVRLGVRYQIAAKHTSFVAVQAGSQEETDTNDQHQEQAQEPSASTAAFRGARARVAPGASSSGFCARRPVSRAQRQPMAPIGSQPLGGYTRPDGEPGNGTLFPHSGQSHRSVSSSARGAVAGFGASSGATSSIGGGLFGGGASTMSASSGGGASFGNAYGASGGGLFGSAPAPAPAPASGGLFGAVNAQALSAQQPLLPPKKKMADAGGGSQSLFDSAPPSPPKSISNGSVVHQLIALQTFSGSWTWSDELLPVLGVSDSDAVLTRLGSDETLAATALVVAFLEGKKGEEKEVWEMVVEKARVWMGGKVGEVKMDELVGIAGAFLAN